MLRVENLGRKFGPRWIFRDLSFQILTGDVLVVTGQNGSGKSTLLKVVAGLLSPSVGFVSRKIDDPRLGIGYAGLDLAMYPTLTAVEHLEIAAELREVDPRTEELLELVQLTRAANQQAGQYSTGMRARLRLALALQARPPILILDEPSASLDETGREIVRKIVELQRVQGATLIATNDPFDHQFATHELNLAS